MDIDERVSRDSTGTSFMWVGSGSDVLADAKAAKASASHPVSE
ncbi:hypothetical protein [Saccharopolyspora hattusasensis]